MGTKAKDNILTVHTAIESVTPVIDATSYMADLRALLIWPSPLIHLRLRFKLQAPAQGTHLHLRLSESILRPSNMGVSL